MDYSKLIDIGSKVSLAVVLMVILFGGVQGYWVSGSTYKDALADRDTWKTLALKGTSLASDTPKAITSGPMPTLPPLPNDATADQVGERLRAIEHTVKYKTEPTDKPL